MIIKMLIENESLSEAFKTENGLSLYIETKKHKLLFDCGAGPLFIDNAKTMDVDLKEVDSLILSHGHFDHGGGLSAFLKINDIAKVYLQPKSFDKYYSKRKDGDKAYIGLEQSLQGNDRFIFTEDEFVIDDELELFADISGAMFIPSGNRSLLKEENGIILADDFAHEQNLIIREADKYLLVAGCAHRGIVNIIESFRIKKGFMPDYIIGGFHLYNRSAGRCEDLDVVTAIGEYLLATNANCYTCHCTGTESYHMLKAVMGERINYLATGSKLTL